MVWVPKGYGNSMGWYKPAVVASAPFTWNPADADADLVFANSNRDLTSTNNGAGSHASVRASAGKTSGLWSCEVTVVSPSLPQPYNELGIMNGAASVIDSYIGQTSAGAAYAWGQQNSFASGVTVANAIPGTQNLAHGDIVTMAMNLNNGKAWLALNNSWLVGDPAADTSPWLTFTVGSDTWYFAAATNNVTGNLATFRLAPTLTYTPPSGFTGING